MRSGLKTRAILSDAKRSGYGVDFNSWRCGSTLAGDASLGLRVETLGNPAKNHPWGLKPDAFCSEYGTGESVRLKTASCCLTDHAPRRARASAERSLRSRWRSRTWTEKRRRSWARRRGHGSPAKAEAGVRNMRMASCQESAESTLALPLRWSVQKRPSAWMLKKTSAGRSASPQTVHRAISGSRPMRRVIHSEK